MGFTAAGISPTTVTTTQQAPLGFVLTVPNGDLGSQEWVYIKATSLLAVGQCACHADGATPYNGSLVNTEGVQPAKVYGIAQHAIALNSYGFVLKRGSGYFRSDGGAVAVNSMIQTSSTSADGCVIEPNLGDGASLGFVTTASATNTTIDPLDASAIVGVALISVGI